MSLKEEILQHEAQLRYLETELVGLKLRAQKLRDDLRAQANPLIPVEKLSPEAVNFANLKFCEELVKIRENQEAAEAIRQALGK
ncbi:MAG: hypothetical protein WCR92_07465 [Candidatus Cloacimonadaceae bacterium]